MHMKHVASYKHVITIHTDKYGDENTYGMETKRDIYPNKALEGKGVPAATEAAATEAARVAENRSEE